MEVTEEQVKSKIKDNGLRATPQRICLLKILMETDQHPSAEMLMQRSREKGYDLSIGTVYNTLESFEDKGIIKRVYDASDVMRYDARTDFHVHLLDRENNVIMDLEDDELEEIIEEHLAGKIPDGFQMSRMDVSLFA
jgi:Fur family peroxide stress response transcriptional regulator